MENESKSSAQGEKNMLLRYLKGNLSDEESYNLENKAMHSASFKEALEGLTTSKITAEEMSSDLDDIRNSWYQKNKKKAQLPAKEFQLWRKIAAAAAIFLVFFVGQQYWQHQQKTSNIFAAHFEENPQAGQISIRGEGVVLDAKLAAGIQLYDEQNYTQSLAVFNTELQENPMETVALLYAGLSALQLGEEMDAENYFQQLASINSEEKNNAHWYLSLLLVKQERYEEAREQLDELLNQPNQDYVKKAQDLLDSLP